MVAGYTTGSIMEGMTDGNVKFVGRLKGSNNLDGLAAPPVYRPVGCPPTQGYENYVELGVYQVDTCNHALRLILVVVDSPDPATSQLNLLPHYFFLVNNWAESERTAEQLVAHYRERGTFEDRLGEFNQAMEPFKSIVRRKWMHYVDDTSRIQLGERRSQRTGECAGKLHGLTAISKSSS